MIRLYMNSLLYIGVPLSLIFGTYFLLTTISFINNSILKKAEVIGNKITKVDTTTDRYNAIIKYNVKDKEYQSLSYTSSNIPSYEKGEKIEILINKDNYKEIRIKNFKEIWLIPSIFYFLAIIFTIIPIYIKKTSFVKKL